MADGTITGVSGQAAGSIQGTNKNQPTDSKTADSSFEQVLNQADNPPSSQVAVRQPTAPWQQMGFLRTYKTNGAAWQWLNPHFDRSQRVTDEFQFEAPAPVLQPVAAAPVAPAPPTTNFAPGVMSLANYPRPTGDNGHGIHWIPTLSQSPAEIDKYVQEAVDMGMKWVVFLNEGSNIGPNDYLVDALTAAGIEPVMRVFAGGLNPLDGVENGDLQKMVTYYKAKGVNYFQLYNEPNLMVETHGQTPDVNRYLDLWIPAAKAVVAGGGLPGFGALSPQGEADDRTFLLQSLTNLKARGEAETLNQGWLAMHNYTGPRALDDPDGFLRFKQYNHIIEQTLGRQLPIIGTEGGTHVTEHVSEAQQIDMVTGAYNYMYQREPYNFAYTYWIIANGHDPAWDEHALFTPEGATSLAQALKDRAGGSV